jgi:plastocyanin
MDSPRRSAPAVESPRAVHHEERTMTRRLILPAFALGFLLASSAWAQHHAGVGKVDYEPNPRGGDPNVPEGCVGVLAKVEISGTATSFSPGTVTIDAGQPVCWTWSGSAHNITSDDLSFTSGLPVERGNFQRTFNTPGTYGYHCQVHGSPTVGMRGTVVVRDASGGGEGPGTLELGSATYTVDENAGPLTVAVHRTGGSEGAASVKYSVSPGTAKPGKDYLPKTGTLKWTNGDQGPKSFAVPLKNDTALEVDEGFTVKLTKATGAALGTNTAAVTIHDDDNPCGSALLAPSQLRAVGQSDSEIRLTWENEPAGAKSLRIERRQPGGAFQEIAAVPAGVNSFTDAGLPGDAIFQYRVRAAGAEGRSAFSDIAAGATDGPTMPCDERNALCLQNGRFEATVQWRPSVDEPARDAKRVALPEAPDTGGLFALSPHEDLMLLLNVLDGCSVNDRYWLYVAAVTDVELTVKVRDSQTGRTWVYFNPAGSTPAPMRDVEAFATCP